MYRDTALNVNVSTHVVWLLVKGETPRKTRGSLIGMVNEREFGVSFLEANITDNMEEGSSTLQARLDNIPPSVGELSHITSPRLMSYLPVYLQQSH